jgi:hypothetical protein
MNLLHGLSELWVHFGASRCPGFPSHFSSKPVRPSFSKEVKTAYLIRFKIPPHELPEILCDYPQPLQISKYTMIVDLGYHGRHKHSTWRILLIIPRPILISFILLVNRGSQNLPVPEPSSTYKLPVHVYTHTYIHSATCFGRFIQPLSGRNRSTQSEKYVMDEASPSPLAWLNI